MKGDIIIRRSISVRRAGQMIAVAIVAVATAGGAAIWLLDKREFPTFGSGLWWSIQTITTVGYGDHVPSTTEGKLVAAVIMISGIGFLTVVTATITAAFVENARRRLGRTRDDAIVERLDRIERRLDELSR